MILVTFFFEYLINEKSVTQDQIVEYLATHAQEISESEIGEDIFSIGADFY